AGSGWIGGRMVGATARVDGGGFFDVFVTVTLPLDCVPPVDAITASVLPAGEGCAAPQVCTTSVGCGLPVPALVSNFDVTPGDASVSLDWNSIAVDQVSGWKLYRSDQLLGSRLLLNSTPIAMGSGGAFHYVDDTVAGGTYTYQLDGLLKSGDEVVVDSRTVTYAGAPKAFSFAAVGASPARGGTTLRYSLPKSANVSIDVYNIAGAKVRTLVSGNKAAGVYTVPFSLNDGAGRKLSPGVYMVRIIAGEYMSSTHVIALP